MNKTYLYNIIKNIAVVFVCWLLNSLALAPADKNISLADEETGTISVIIDVPATEIDSFLFEDENDAEKFNLLIPKRNNSVSTRNIFGIKSKIPSNSFHQKQCIFLPGINSDLPPPLASV